MTKKVRPRWNENGVVETQEFTFSGDQLAAISAMLGLNEGDDLPRLERELQDIAGLYLRWRTQDDEGPSRAERNAALRETAEAGERFETLLGALDHASEAELIDALRPYTVSSAQDAAPGDAFADRQSPELGFRQLQILRDRLGQFNAGLGSLLKHSLQQRGPATKKTLPIIVGYLAKVYETETGKAVTHNPYRGVGDYSGQPQSQAGRFMTAFFEIVDPDIPATSVATELARLIRRRKASRRSTI